MLLILADTHGNVIHLFERDCSVQRRHQKVVELAPAPNISADLRSRLCADAVAFARQIGYSCAGTVEFLVDADTTTVLHRGESANPGRAHHHRRDDRRRHRAIAAWRRSGERLDGPDIGLRRHKIQIATHGFAIQCRVTTEDPANKFRPDTGRRSPPIVTAGGIGHPARRGTAF